ncbi:autotransporter outer membrane beta-barrel domain-containing protein [Pseudemcibacter aquimaris]|uniref:autotransporter outer membrane beta-barrel domain-containing protein n=1 Tax=Pseudemcibacter aquimaris TaxID=2857064 RepID=UPI0020128B80|nr:autotransporter outer membrane beta-barrel domain-containing protein [Pseudemcibacter aquimaris]WDU59959.1 autotransporter domain-containing protein [Pseudemcibacter aquimaris]
MLTTTAMLGTLALFASPAMAACPTGTFDLSVTGNAEQEVLVGHNTPYAVNIENGGTLNGIYADGTGSLTLCNEAGGTINGNGAPNDIAVDNRLTGTNYIYNEGLIISTDDVDPHVAIVSGGDGTVENVAGGVIYGNSSSLVLSGTGYTINNSGIIGKYNNEVSDEAGIFLNTASSTLTNSVGGEIYGNFYGVFSNQNELIYNHGLISATGASSGQGVVLADGGTINNYAGNGTTTGVIKGDLHGVFIVDGGIIINSGLISGTNGNGIWAEGETTITNFEGGSIVGGTVAINGGAGNQDVINHGSITGDVNLGAGSDTYYAILDGAYSIDGIVDGGSDEDTVFFQTNSDVDFTFDEAQYLNFENHTLFAGDSDTNFIFRSAETITGVQFQVNGSGTLTNYANFDVIHNAFGVTGTTIYNNGGITSANTALSLNNSYFINQGSVTGSGAQAVYMSGSSSLFNGVDGLIAGPANAITGDSNNQHILTYGVISGNVSLGAGNDSYSADLSVGTYHMDDTIDGGAGTDRFYVGSGDNQSFTFDASKILNFETFHLNPYSIGTSLTFNSVGTIDNGFYVYGAGTLISNADFNVSGEAALDMALNSNLTNNGTVVSDTVGVRLDEAKLLTNTGSITGDTYGVEMTFNNMEIDNQGTIAGGTGIHSTSLSTVTINNKVSGLIDGDTYGINVTDGTSNITNSGTIVGVTNGIRSESAMTVNNMAGNGTTTGLITGDIGIFDVNGGVSVNNWGTITGQAAQGISFSQGGTVTNHDSGVINGAFSAVEIRNQTGTVINEGLISSPTNYAVYLEGGGTVDNRLGGVITGQLGVTSDEASFTVTNAGTISGSQRSVNFEHGGSLTNLSTGVISGDGTGVSVYHDTISAVVNHGRITSNNSHGVYLYDAGTVTNQVGGIITGDVNGVFVASGAATVVNHGTINGDVIFNDGSDHLTFGSGSMLNGDADGGDGTDYFFTEGDHTIGIVDNFEHGIISGGSVSWADTSVDLHSLTVDNAQLTFQGMADAALTVNGGTLSGNGTFGSLIIQGITAPGNSAGTTTVVGNYEQAATGIYEAEVYADLKHDLIDVGGSASLDGTLEIQLGDDVDDYTAGDTFTVLSADGGIIGDYADYRTIGGTETLYGGYSIIGNDVVVELFNPYEYFTDLADSTNNTQSSGIIASIATSSTAGSALFNASTGDVNTVMQQASGETHATMMNIIGTDGNEYINAVNSEIRTVEMGQMSTWAKAYGLGGTASTDGNARGYEHDTKGFAFGYGYGVSDDVTVGIHGGLNTSNATFGVDVGKAASKEFGVFLASNLEGVNFNVAYSHGWHDVEMSRVINYAGTALNNHDTTSNKFYAEASTALNIDRIKIEPTIGYNYSKISAVSLNETGAGVANLNGATNAFKSSQLRGGAKFSFDHIINDGANISPNAKVMYVSEMGDLNGGLVTGYEGHATNTFNATGLTMDKGRVEVDAGVHYQKGNMSFNVGYRGTYMSRIKSHGGRAGVTLVW